MTTGAVLFAFNNEEIDYVAIAAWTAANIRRHLHIPVALITDVETTSSAFDVVIPTTALSGGVRYFEDYEATVTWNNASRVDAYALTPFDRTLVLDVDYVVASNTLQPLLHADHDFLAHSDAYDVVGVNDFNGLNYFGNYNMPMTWATVMMFRRSTHAKMIFDSMRMVRDNWQHYKRLYATSSPAYRNDFALSIAQNIVSGHTLTYPSIPWKLASLTPEHQLTQLHEDCYRVNFIDSNKRSQWIELQGCDFHAMGKKHLGDIVANSS